VGGVIEKWKGTERGGGSWLKTGCAGSCPVVTSKGVVNCVWKGLGGLWVNQKKKGKCKPGGPSCKVGEKGWNPLCD